VANDKVVIPQVLMIKFGCIVQLDLFCSHRPCSCPVDSQEKMKTKKKIYFDNCQTFERDFAGRVGFLSSFPFLFVLFVIIFG